MAAPLRSITRNTLIALGIGSLGGLLFVVFLQEFHRYTSTNAFCTSCHSMTYAAAAYEQSRHFRSASGVRAGCADCHVSGGLFAATWDHLVGGKDLLKQVFGPDYDDPVVNTLHLPDAAFAARDWFRRRDSATCRACHQLEAIEGSRSGTAAIHREDATAKTCIDCHYNLVHRRVPERATFKRTAWNRMVEDEFGLAPGTAARLLADGPGPGAATAADVSGNAVREERE